MPGFPNTVERRVAYYHRVKILERRLLSFSLFNFFVVTVSGLLLRGIPLGINVPLTYGNILHGHSHFAFGGWVTPGLIWLIMKAFPELTHRVAYAHWRNMLIMLLLSAYGMLISFPLQGYAAVSITFSTLSIAATFYFAVMLLRASRGIHEISINFLRAGLLFLMLSSLGPFALGAIVASGNAASPVYFNSIYFYLHFQYNGWFTFAILAVAYRKFILQTNAGRAAFILLFTGCILSLLLSFTWNQPGLVVNIIGGGGAAMQLAGVLYLIYDLSKNRTTINITWLEKIALSAFGLKILLQLSSAFPVVAAVAYLHRNYIIAYLHLVMLGFVTTFILGSIIQTLAPGVSKALKPALILFLSSFILSELLLVFHDFPLPVFIVSCGFPVAALVIYRIYMVAPELRK
ncbi:MAG: hypothetical protein JNK79_12980 [Chitinophagaceae bacterium]|nr:hypothetical protein [Chitinophagaceae bacterium]